MLEEGFPMIGSGAIVSSRHFIRTRTNPKTRNQRIEMLYVVISTCLRPCYPPTPCEHM